MNDKPIAIVAPNYSPRTCGVGDYSMRLAQALRRMGVDAIVLAGAPVEPHPEAPNVPVVGFESESTREFARCLEAWTENRPAGRMLLQYTSQSYRAGKLGNWVFPKMMRRLTKRGWQMALMVHEPFVPWSIRPDRLVVAASQRAALACIARAANRIIVSTETRRSVVEPWVKVGFHRGAVAVIPVGANALPVARQPSGAFRLGTFTTLAHGKRLDVILDAFSTFSDAVPGAELLLVGDFDSSGASRASELRSAVAKHPWAKQIYATGKLPLSEVSSAISSLDVFLFAMDTGASTRSGTLPTALGAGVPVVAIRGSETDSVFVDRDNVLFAASLSGPAFAEAVLRLYSERALSRHIGEGAKRLYEERLRWDQIAAEYLRLFE